MNIAQFSNDELRQEIERRNIALTKPQLTPYAMSDVDKLQKVCERYIESMAGGIYFKDSDVHISEAAIELFYGKDVWNWVNERQDKFE